MQDIQKWKAGDQRVIVHLFTAKDVEAFADMSGDINPIHLSREFASETSMGEPVVHGMLAAAHISALIGNELPGPGALWLSFNINWRQPIRINDNVKFTAVVKAVHHSSNTMAVEIAGTDIDGTRKYFDAEATVSLLSASEKQAAKAADTDRDLLLAGKHIVVTGGNGALGSGIASKLASMGAELTLLGRDPGRLKAAAVSLAAQCRNVITTDLRDAYAIETACGAILESGDIHGLVHAAAPNAEAVRLTDKKSASEMQAHFDVGPVAFHQLILGLQAGLQSGASICAISTQYTLDMPPEGMGAYSAAKLALLGLVRTLAIELGPRNIRCNAVSPSMMDTPFSRDVPQATKRIEEAKNPLRRLCSVEDVAATVTFLMGPGASFINGANIPVTGGLTAG